MPSDVGRLKFFLGCQFFCSHRVPSDVGRLKFFLVSIFLFSLLDGKRLRGV